MTTAPNDPAPSRGPALALITVVSLAYGAAIGNRFVYDDLPSIPWNPRVTDPSRLLECFTTPFWGEASQTALYRPLTLLSFALNHAVGGIDPRGYVLVDLLLHTLAALLVLVVARDLGAREGAARAAALVFALHPALTEAVTFVSGRSELLVACAGLGCLLAHRRERPVLTGALWLLALLCKESAIAIPGILLASDLLLPTGGPRWSARRWGPLAAAALLYLGARVGVLGAAAWAPQYVIPLDNPLVPQVTSVLGTSYGATAWERVLSGVANLTEPARLLLWPGRLSIDHSFAQLPLTREPTLRLLLGAALLLGTVGGVWALRRRAPLAAFALAVLLVTWAIPSNLVVRIGTVFAERLLYLPAIGFALLVGWAWDAARHRAPDGGARTALVIGLALALGLATFRIRQRVPEFQNRLTIWRAAVRDCPQSARARFKLGDVLRALGDALTARDPARGHPVLLEAARQYRRSLELYPEQSAVALSLASCLESAGKPSEAAAALDHALRLLPPSAERDRTLARREKLNQR